jgi:peptidoglycan/xylan/chitin deacetylase (PgdA/CDA1 family)
MGQPLAIFSITLDDGKSSQIRELYPILRKYGFSATFYVVAGEIGLPGKLSIEDLRALVQEGNEIGSHGFTHRSLLGLDVGEVENELRKSREVLRPFNASAFAYPFGHYDRRTVSMVAQYYDSARAYGDAVRVNRSSLVERYALESFPVEGSFSARMDPRAPEYLLSSEEAVESDVWFILTLHGRSSINLGNIRTIFRRVNFTQEQRKAYLNSIRSSLLSSPPDILGHFETFCGGLSLMNARVLTVSDALKQLL